jgi:hypothetical protein
MLVKWLRMNCMINANFKDYIKSLKNDFIEEFEYVKKLLVDNV